MTSSCYYLETAGNGGGCYCSYCRRQSCLDQDVDDDVGVGIR